MEHHDLDALLRLFDAVAEEQVWIGTEPGYDRQPYREKWERWMRDPRFGLFVALDGTTVAGNISVVPDPDGFEIGMLVALAHRGKGVGTALLQRAVEWAEEHDIATLHLTVFPHNAPALALYRKMGFVEVERQIARIRRRNGEAWDVIHMHKSLR